jgi:hypothetical protein
MNKIIIHDNIVQNDQVSTTPALAGAEPIGKGSKSLKKNPKGNNQNPTSR